MEWADILNSDVIIAIHGFFVWLWSQWETQVLVYHILINFVVAVAVSIYTKKFQLGRLWEFLYRKVLPFVMVYAVFAAGGEAIGQANAALVVWGLLTAALLRDLLENLVQLGIELGIVEQPRTSFLVNGRNGD